MAEQHTPNADRAITAEREFDAPREMVFDAWFDPKHITHWWGPRGFSTTTHQMNVEPGGVWRFTMHGPDGRDYPNKVVYREITRPEKLVYEHEDDGGTEPVSFRTTVTFTESAGKTRVAVHMVFDSRAERDRVAEEYGACEGLRDTLERLGDCLGEFATA